jgi:acid phosphatase family membrane protein YuiD
MGRLPYIDISDYRIELCSLRLDIMLDLISNILDTIFTIVGAYGPIWLYFYLFYILWTEHEIWYFWVVFVGALINDLINGVLKLYIKEPRPSEYPVDKSRSAYYGMPSGHAQHAGYILAVLWHVGNIPTIHIIAATAVGIITWIERWVHKRHTAKQVAAGGILGLAVGAITAAVHNDVC